MKILLILNDAPYGTEKAYNALRLAMALQKEQADTEVLIFLMADAVTCAMPKQATPQGYYNLERTDELAFKPKPISSTNIPALISNANSNTVR